ncbi:MAG: DUF4007 family protein [Desulfobacterales bacterium]|nr:DUF4007 family protein [Desulfobacterales bacterium]
MSIRKAKFSGHQTFCFRYGWLEKGFRFVKNGHWFAEHDAIVDLGVGKNMVDSIRYWCEMAGIIEDQEVSDLGRKIFDEKNGWDPFLEDNATLWLLHWKLNTNPNVTTAGTALFSYLHKPEFSKHDVAQAALKSLAPNKKPPSDKVIMRDVDCYLRTYAGGRKFDPHKLKEESFECPFQELNLIHPMKDSDLYRFSIGPKSSLSPEIIGFAIFEYLNQKSARGGMRIQEALYHEFSPGQVFMLDENAMIEAVQLLETSPKWGEKYGFTESAGVAFVRCEMEEHEAWDLLNDYYKGTPIHG